jgi:two-component system C4-dicarboxylate transport sensor histidine kinase DctB
MKGGPGHFFALGTVSHRRGYYFSYPVLNAGETIGVVVVKAGIDSIEEAWRQTREAVLVSDGNGIIVLASEPDWRMTTLRPPSSQILDQITRDRQFDPAKLTPVPWTNRRKSPIELPMLDASTDGADDDTRSFLLLTEHMPSAAWDAQILIDTEGAFRQTQIAVVLVAILLLVIGLIAVILRERRLRFEERLAAKEEAHDRLERAVDQRTHELSLANRSLEQEVGERRLAEDELRQTQAELIQAGKLAALGQMSAALSHEFNQPLTAIRTYAENAIALFERGRQAEAEENIKQVSQLTEQMAELSKHLSRFARKPQIKTRSVSLIGALQETLSMLQGRLEKQEVEAVIDLPSEDVWVIGGHIRLQQVMMNLITNALDAMRGEAFQVLDIRVARQGGRVKLMIADSGAGIAPEIFDRIFDPFVTTKEVGQGLGLGLSISFNIIKDFGGSLTARNRDEGGACFTVDLKAAEPAGELAAE